MTKNSSNQKPRKSNPAPRANYSNKNAFALPTPIELATIAAILQPDPTKATFEPKFGVERAMEFYLEAVDFLKGKPANFEKLVGWYGSRALKDKLLHKEVRKLDPIVAKERKRILTMGPQSQAADDEVLRYLNARGWKIETTKAVREFLMRWHDRPPAEIPINMRILPEWRQRTAKEFIKQFKGPKWRYQFPELLLTRAAEYSAWTKSQSNLKGAETKRNRRSKK